MKQVVDGKPSFFCFIVWVQALVMIVRDIAVVFFLFEESER